MKIDTQTKLLKTAVIKFAKYGFDGSSTRVIAKKAGVNISAITYYYGSKKELYEAVLWEVVRKLTIPFKDLEDRYKKLGGDKEKSKELLKDFFERFLTAFTEDGEDRYLIEIFFSEYFNPSSSFDILYKNALLPYLDMMASTLAKLSLRKINKSESYLRTLPFMSQIIVFGARKEPVCQLLGWDGFGSEEKETFLKNINRQIDSLHLHS